MLIFALITSDILMVTFNWPHPRVTSRYSSNVHLQTVVHAINCSSLNKCQSLQYIMFSCRTAFRRFVNICQNETVNVKTAIRRSVTVPTVTYLLSTITFSSSTFRIYNFIYVLWNYYIFTCLNLRVIYTFSWHVNLHQNLNQMTDL